MPRSSSFALLTVALATGCVSSLPSELPPLEALVEPPAFLEEPDDESARRALPMGAFSGLVVVDARDSLAAMAGAPEGLRVARVVENSPAAFAGLEVDDLLFEVELAGRVIELDYPSRWRAIELEEAPGSELTLLYDRGGREREARLTLVERAFPADRVEAARFREEERVGVVLRTATEVEARAAGLPPGAGVVLVGMALSSPWRDRGVVYGDLLVAVDGDAIEQPEQLIARIREAGQNATLEVERVRGESREVLELPVSRRERAVREVRLPFLFRYDRDAEERSWSAVLGLLSYRSTAAAWRLRVLWFLRFGGGSMDRLEEVGQ